MLLTGFEGKTIAVTGAAGGIGTAICRTLTAAGSRLMAVDRDPEALDRLVRGMPTATVASAAVDVADTGAVEGVLDRAEAQLGPLSGLVNAAGVLRAGSALTCSDDDWDALLRVNATGVFTWSRAAARRMAGRGSGAIVTVASNCVGVPRSGMAAYSASKAAAAAFTLSLGLEVAPDGVRCNVVCPGTTDTSMLDVLGPDSASKALAGNPAAFRIGVPLGRVAGPQDIADSVAYLLSDQARHITMHNLYVDGGASLHV